MAEALLDTNVLFAGMSARDEFHEPAREIIRGVDRGRLPDGLVTDYVVAEVLNLTREKLGPDVATELLDRLLEGAHFEIEQTTNGDFNAAQAIFRRFDSLSFVDATLTAYAEREDVQYMYSFDADFDVVDALGRLDTADNPFE